MNYQLRFQSHYSFALLSVAHIRSVSVCLSYSQHQHTVRSELTAVCQLLLNVDRLATDFWWWRALNRQIIRLEEYTIIHLTLIYKLFTELYVSIRRIYTSVNMF